MWRKTVLSFSIAAVGGAVCYAQDATPARPRITGIAFVEFFESNMDAAKIFYREKLGLRETARTSSLYEFNVNPRQEILIVPPPDPAPPNRLAAVGFRTSDLNAMMRYLQAKNVPVELLPGPMLRLHDAAGTELRFVADELVKRKGDIEVLFYHAKPFKQTSERIIHAGWGVRDQAAEDKLFRDVLGFRPYWHGGAAPGQTDWVSLQVPDGTDWIEYMLKFDPEHDTAKQLGGMDHVSLGVEKITEVSDKLLANGWTDASSREPKIGHDGKWQLNVFDPDLSRVEFMEFKPTGTTCCSEFTAAHPSRSDKEP